VVKDSLHRTVVALTTNLVAVWFGLVTDESQEEEDDGGVCLNLFVD
jgi:hypothetical protein